MQYGVIYAPKSHIVSLKSVLAVVTMCTPLATTVRKVVLLVRGYLKDNIESHRSIVTAEPLHSF